MNHSTKKLPAITLLAGVTFASGADIASSKSESKFYKDFNAPNAKFVLATMGEATKDRTENTGKVLAAHLAVDGASGRYPEFTGNVAMVYTNPMGKAMVALLNNKYPPGILLAAVGSHGCR